MKFASIVASREIINRYGLDELIDETIRYDIDFVLFELEEKLNYPKKFEFIPGDLRYPFEQMEHRIVEAIYEQYGKSEVVNETVTKIKTALQYLECRYGLKKKRASKP